MNGLICSAEFQVMVFTSNQKTIKAVPHLYLCDDCKQNYGSCSLFVTHDLVLEQLKGAVLHLCNVQEDVEPIDNSATEFMHPQSFS